MIRPRHPLPVSEPHPFIVVVGSCLEGVNAVITEAATGHPRTLGILAADMVVVKESSDLATEEHRGARLSKGEKNNPEQAREIAVKMFQQFQPRWRRQRGMVRRKSKIVKRPHTQERSRAARGRAEKREGWREKPMEGKGARFVGVELYFEDLKRAKTFYTEALGLAVSDEQEGRHAKFESGAGFICLERKGAESYPSKDKAVLFFEVGDVGAAIEAVGRERFVQIEGNWAVLHDPEGHNVLLIQRAK